MNLSLLLNRKRLLGLIVALILLLAIPATLLLTRSSQDIRQRASEKAILPISNGPTIKGYVYADEDRNGIFSPQEKGIAMVQIQLLTPDKKTFTETTTNEQGYYEFNQLQQNHYIVHINPPLDIKLAEKNDLLVDSEVLSDSILYNFPAIDLNKNIYDLNLNGQFDNGDLSILTDCIKNISSCSNTNRMDYKHDNVLDGADLNILLRAYKADVSLNTN